MTKGAIESGGQRAVRATRPNREGVKVCPRCGAKTFSDMDICYGCLYDFTTGEGEVSLEGIRHENEKGPWGSSTGCPGLDEPDFCLSDIAELALGHDAAGLASSLAAANGCDMRPDDAVASGAASSPEEATSGTNGGVPRRAGCCCDGAPCVRVVASDVPIVVEVVGPSVTIRQLDAAGGKACPEAPVQNEAEQ